MSSAVKLKAVSPADPARKLQAVEFLPGTHDPEQVIYSLRAAVRAAQDIVAGHYEAGAQIHDSGGLLIGLLTTAEILATELVERIA